MSELNGKQLWLWSESSTWFRMLRALNHYETSSKYMSRGSYPIYSGDVPLYVAGKLPYLQRGCSPIWRIMAPDLILVYTKDCATVCSAECADAIFRNGSQHPANIRIIPVPRLPRGFTIKGTSVSSENSFCNGVGSLFTSNLIFYQYSIVSSMFNNIAWKK